MVQVDNILTDIIGFDLLNLNRLEIYLTILSELYHLQHHIYFLKCSTLTLMKNIHLNNVIIAFIYNYVMDISTPKLFVHVTNNNLHFQ
jgi:hypothetical protein